MKQLCQYPRCLYSILFLAVLAVEILIALYVRDAWIRPYGGDVLVTVCIGFFVRIWLPHRYPTLPLWIFLFAAAVEIGQYLDFVSLLGLDHIPFFRILLGTTFSWADLFCYGAGCLLFLLADRFLQSRIHS